MRLKIVEILHIDTVDSRNLYESIGVNPDEKSGCQKILKNSFEIACNKYQGTVKHWAGDGGYAYFFAEQEPGNSVKAAKYFLQKICDLNATTARSIDTDRFFRSFRIKAHTGQINVTSDPTVDSALPEDLDEFIKHEKKFAPKENEFFITEKLYRSLSSQNKKLFGKYNEIKTDTFKTFLYLLKRTPKKKAENIFERGDRVDTITQDDWNYLRDHIWAHKINIGARNRITMGLAEHIHATRKNGQLITSNKLFELTLEGVYNYLKATHDKDKIDFSVVYWMPFKKNQKKYLKMYGFRLPEGNIAKSKQRVVPEDDFKFKVCQCFQKMESIASPSVLSDFHEKIWHYFDQNQKKFKRGMESAIQIPVYFMHLGVKVPKGVLSIDSSRPNLFLNEEMSLVKEELLHYLVNLCLATSLYEKGV